VSAYFSGGSVQEILTGLLKEFGHISQPIKEWVNPMNNYKVDYIKIMVEEVETQDENMEEHAYEPKWYIRFISIIWFLNLVFKLCLCL
jgi:hypothetical protein